MIPQNLICSATETLITGKIDCSMINDIYSTLKVTFCNTVLKNMAHKPKIVNISK
jgi:hypothetical protein